VAWRHAENFEGARQNFGGGSGPLWHPPSSAPVEDPVEKMLAAPNRPQKQTVDPATSNSETLVDSAVTVYQVNIDQGSPNYSLRAGPNPAREAISSGSRRHFVNNEKIMYLRNICWFGRMQHILKQSQYVRCLALELLCNSFCDPLTRRFGDPWYKSVKSSGDSIHPLRSLTHTVNGCDLNPRTQTQTSE